jgi:hypothetical protein
LSVLNTAKSCFDMLEERACDCDLMYGYHCGIHRDVLEMKQDLDALANGKIKY